MAKRSKARVFDRSLAEIAGSNPCRSQWPSGLRRGSGADRLLGLRVRIPPAAWMRVFCESCVLSGRDLGDGPIPRPEES